MLVVGVAQLADMVEKAMLLWNVKSIIGEKVLNTGWMSTGKKK